MRFFLLHPETIVPRGEIGKRTKISTAAVSRELALFKKIGFVSEKAIVVSGKRGKKREKGLRLNPSFSYLLPVQKLLLNSEPIRSESILRSLKNAGNIKLVVISGIFTHHDNSRADILIVGDKLRRASLESLVQGLEAKLGAELSYAIFDTEEFQYRLHAHDRFVRDILDFPHKKLLNKLGL